MDKEMTQGFKRVDMKLSVMEERIANLEKKSPGKTKIARPAHPKEDRGAIGGRDVDVRLDFIDIERMTSILGEDQGCRDCGGNDFRLVGCVTGIGSSLDFKCCNPSCNLTVELSSSDEW